MPHIHTEPFEEQLRRFLTEATKNLRNGPRTEVYQDTGGATVVIYTSDDYAWQAIQRCSSNKLDSTLSIYYKERQVFILSCAHVFLDFFHRNAVFNCLHSALLDPDPDFPVRGSNINEHRERQTACYHNRSRGFTAQDLSDFSGSESVTIPDNDGHLRCIYSAQYSGGIIAQHIPLTT